MLGFIKNKLVPDTNDLIYRFCRLTYVKKMVNSSVILVMAVFLRILLYTLLSLVIVFNNIFVDFVVQCGISIYLCTRNQDFLKIVELFEPQFYDITRYVINNFSNDKFQKWKNYTIISSLLISYICFIFIEINSALIRLYILQYIVCYVYLDIYENSGSVIKKELVSFIKKHEKTTNKILIKLIGFLKVAIKYEADDECIIMDESMYDLEGFVAVEKIEKKMPISISQEFEKLMPGSISQEFDIIDTGENLTKPNNKNKKVNFKPMAKNPSEFDMIS